MNLLEILEYDRLRFGGGKFSYLKNPILRFLLFFRITQYLKRNKYNPIYIFSWLCYRHLKIKYGFELEQNCNVGYGLLIVHLGGIKINEKAVIGNNCTLFSGCVIGSIRDGKRKGSPVLGDDVYVGVNAAIVGGINIGNDVVIAPNSFVNVDVPSHSVVFGNPAQIVYKANAAKYYTYNKVNLNDETTNI